MHQASQQEITRPWIEEITVSFSQTLMQVETPIFTGIPLHPTAKHTTLWLCCNNFQAISCYEEVASRRVNEKLPRTLPCCQKVPQWCAKKLNGLVVIPGDHENRLDPQQGLQNVYNFELKQMSERIDRQGGAKKHDGANNPFKMMTARSSWV